MGKTLDWEIWSKRFLIRPRDHFKTRKDMGRGVFRASYEKPENKCDPPMSLLLAMEYGRIWHKENAESIKNFINLQKSKTAGVRERMRLKDNAELQRRINVTKKKYMVDACTTIPKAKKWKKRKINCDKEDKLYCSCKDPNPSATVRCENCGTVIVIKDKTLHGHACGHCNKPVRGMA